MAHLAAAVLQLFPATRAVSQEKMFTSVMNKWNVKMLFFVALTVWLLHGNRVFPAVAHKARRVVKTP